MCKHKTYVILCNNIIMTIIVITIAIMNAGNNCLGIILLNLQVGSHVLLLLL